MKEMNLIPETGKPWRGRMLARRCPKRLKKCFAIARITYDFSKLGEKVLTELLSGFSVLFLRSFLLNVKPVRQQQSGFLGSTSLVMRQHVSCSIDYSAFKHSLNKEKSPESMWEV